MRVRSHRDREKNAPQTTQDKGGLIRLFYTGGRDATRGVVCRACVCEWAESPDFGLVFVGLNRASARVQGSAGELGVKRRRRGGDFVGASVSKMETRGDRPRQRELVLPRSEVK